MFFLKKYSVLHWLILIAFTIIAYSSALTTEFAIHNDYRAFDIQHYSINIFDGWHGILKHMESMHLMYIGRPLNAILFNFQQSLIHTIEDFRYARYLSLATLILISFITYLKLHQKLKYLNVWLLIVAFGILSIPSANLYVCWISNYVPGSLNLLLSLLAWLLFDHSIRHTSIYVRYWGLFFSYLTLLAACLNYPATALFFGFIPFVRLVLDKGDWSEVKHNALFSLGFLLLTLVSYVLIHKLLLYKYFSHLFGSEFRSYDPVSYKFTFAINQNLFKLLIEAVTAGFSIYSTHVEKYYLSLINILILFISLLITSSLIKVNDFTRLSQKELKERAIIIIAFLAVSLSPILLTPNGFVAYRILYVFFIFCFVLTIFAYRTCINLLRLYFKFDSRRLGSLILVSFTVCTFFTVTAMTQNSRLEYLYFKEQVANLPRLTDHALQGAQPINIFVTLPKRFEPFVNYSLPYDLSYTATNYSGLMEAVVYMIADEQHVRRDAYRIRVLNRVYKENYIPPPDIKKCTNCIFIDTTKIKKMPLNFLPSHF